MISSEYQLPKSVIENGIISSPLKPFPKPSLNGSFGQDLMSKMEEKFLKEGDKEVLINANLGKFAQNRTNKFT